MPINPREGKTEQVQPHVGMQRLLSAFVLIQNNTRKESTTPLSIVPSRAMYNKLAIYAVQAGINLFEVTKHLPSRTQVGVEELQLLPCL